MRWPLSGQSESSFSDLLNYAHLVGNGVMLNKDGAFLVSYQFKGVDSHSASGSELNSVVNSFNRMATLLDDGWMLHVDELRLPSRSYAPLGAAKEKGLIIENLEDNPVLQEDVLSVFYATIITFEATTCVKLIENHNGIGLYSVIQ